MKSNNKKIQSYLSKISGNKRNERNNKNKLKIVPYKCDVVTTDHPSPMKLNRELWDGQRYIPDKEPDYPDHSYSVIGYVTENYNIDIPFRSIYFNFDDYRWYDLITCVPLENLGYELLWWEYPIEFVK